MTVGFPTTGNTDIPAAVFLKTLNGMIDVLEVIHEFDAQPVFGPNDFKVPASCANGTA